MPKITRVVLVMLTFIVSLTKSESKHEMFAYTHQTKPHVSKKDELKVCAFVRSVQVKVPNTKVTAIDTCRK